MFDHYRLLLGSIAALSTDEEVALAASRLSSHTAEYQKNCVERVSLLTSLSKECNDINILCDKELEKLSKFGEDVNTDTIG